ncbi:zinc-binding dehydrogenase [Actinoplanes sp. CA-252034]|uniref:zinc-binding dehydrogenase n=1 Tax=Actinoplanes sp. CA-252034 TaxID=3239906 RepID=UPI003D97B754
MLGIEQLFGFGRRVPRWASQIMSLAAEGIIRPLIGQTFSLEQAAEAHAAIEGRTAVGKTLLLLGEDPGRRPSRRRTV